MAELPALLLRTQDYLISVEMVTLVLNDPMARLRVEELVRHDMSARATRSGQVVVGPLEFSWRPTHDHSLPWTLVASAAVTAEADLEHATAEDSS